MLQNYTFAPFAIVAMMRLGLTDHDDDRLIDAGSSLPLSASNVNALRE